jgi:hypothetical protein
MLKKIPFTAILMAMLVVSIALLLASCGGAGGVGSGGSGTGTLSSASQTEGLVSGFGSLIVDSTEFADSNAAVQAEAADGSVANAEAKLGQRVLVTYDSSNNAAAAIRILPQLIAPVTSVPDATGWLQVAQQGVQLVDTASATASRPATALSGYNRFTAITVGDELEVHGNWVLDSSRNAWVLVASRAEKRSTLGTQVLLGGVVQTLTSSAGTYSLHLNAAGGTLVQASSVPTGLQTGQVVSVWANRNALSISPLQALRVTLPGVASSVASSSNDALTLSGLASQYDPVARTVSVQGTRVTLPPGTTLDNDALQNGGYLTVSGKPDGKGMQATNAMVAQPGKGTPPRPVELKGVISGVNWTAASVSFSLRDTAVNATAAVIDKSCRLLASSTEAYVEVVGNTPLPNAAVVASTVKCSATAPADAIVRRSGKVLSTSDLSLRLQTDTNTVVTVTVDSNTFTEQPLASLVGLTVAVEGVVTTGTSSLRARKIKRVV